MEYSKNSPSSAGWDELHKNEKNICSTVRFMV